MNWFLSPSLRVLMTDASKVVWGVVLDNVLVQGNLSLQETLLLFNILELRAIRLALKLWCVQLRGLPVQLDNATAVVYVNRRSTRNWAEGSASHPVLGGTLCSRAVHCLYSIERYSIFSAANSCLCGSGLFSRAPRTPLGEGVEPPDVYLPVFRFNVKLHWFVSRTKDLPAF